MMRANGHCLENTMNSTRRPGNEHLVLFYEYFHGDTGKGLGAAHQTGWTALVADLIERLQHKQ